MDNYFEHECSIRDRIEQGTSMCPPKYYPQMMFKCGLLFQKINDFGKVFSLMEALEYVRAQERISESFEAQIFSFIYENPEFYDEITKILDRLIDCKPVSVVMELQKLQSLKDETSKKEIRNEQLSSRTNEQNIDQISQPFKKSSTLLIQNIQNKFKQDNDNDSNKTEKFDEQYFENIQKMNIQSENLAKMLQQEEQKNAKLLKVGDEATCQICYVGLYEEEFFPLQLCGHIFHKNCLSEYFKSEISVNRFPLKCPDDVCKAQTKDSDIKMILQSKLYEKYEKHTLKAYAETHGDSISWCPTANCEYIFFFEKDDSLRFQCLDCKKEYCLDCRVDWHKDMTCKQYKISSTHSDADEAFMAFAKGKKFKQCPKCKFWVQKNEGCDHMTCKCKFQFCYKCGGVYMKCECVQKARVDMQRRRQMAEQRRLNKLKKLQKKNKTKEQIPKSERSKRRR